MKIYIFQTKTHFLGIRESPRRFLKTNLVFISHPLQLYWNIPPNFPICHQIFSQISIFGEFRYRCLKFGTFRINIHGEKYFQSCWLIFQLCNVCKTMIVRGIQNLETSNIDRTNFSLINMKKVMKLAYIPYASVPRIFCP